MRGKAALRNIFDATLEAIDPGQLVQKSCRYDGRWLNVQEKRYDLERYGRIFLFGSGKAAGPMAAALCEILGERITSGVIVVPNAVELPAVIRQCLSTHPLPSQQSIAAAEAMQEAISACKEEDLYLYLLSGGSSALMEKPLAPVTLEELQKNTELMLGHDLPIDEVNILRKHLSAVKGGRLARHTDATGIVLVLSDVPGDDLHTIGSAPLYCDESSFGDALRIVEAHGLADHLPESVLDVLQAGKRGDIEETPTAPPPKVRHFIVGSNALARRAACERAAAIGYATVCDTPPLEGAAETMGRALLGYVQEHALTRPTCWVFGGETTVDVKGSGRGGRNQQLCLAALDVLPQDASLALLCAGTDGIDGNSHAAGAVIDRQTRYKAEQLGLDIAQALQENDATPFFEKCGDLVVTGPTGTNVMDIAILIKGE